ncbi:pyridoxamine 5'-phosphate oxidase family protein [Quadrisphaera sp. DSM 44207]|uniref:pyridoxamine 5'-phosphate oxidase family protein n=1 Tax=Quadrisphaera sp. DSM 44207 TaxID=1881057 RepID=UPI000888A3B4|nr:TIGR03618 family F420-dependent PPOX class oxidoreductase [Quadrisphaera sp. DSM 44207]SDQ76466.1 PPOX class probable F420-dependent enzyme [Quadrisphaera sp. DSM 44207]
MADRSPAVLTAAALRFVTERRLATLTTLRPDGTPHVVPVGFTWDVEDGLARVTARRTSRKVLNARRGGRAALCSVEGARWLTLEGAVAVRDDEDAVADAVRRYADRYQRTPAPDPLRVVVEVAVDRVLSSAHLRQHA